MTTSKAKALHRARLHHMQRAINVEEHLSLHWDDFGKLAESLNGKKAKLINDLMEVQSCSVSETFAGPLTQGNMASPDLEPRSPIFESELMATSLLDEDDLEIIYSSLADQFDALMNGDWKAVRRECGALHALMAKLIALMEGE
jgi:hypothetical protein